MNEINQIDNTFMNEINQIDNTSSTLINDNNNNTLTKNSSIISEDDESTQNRELENLEKYMLSEEFNENEISTQQAADTLSDIHDFMKYSFFFLSLRNVLKPLSPILHVL